MDREELELVGRAASNVDDSQADGQTAPNESGVPAGDSDTVCLRAPLTSDWLEWAHAAEGLDGKAWSDAWREQKTRVLTLNVQISRLVGHDVDEGWERRQLESFIDWCSTPHRMSWGRYPVA